MNTTCLDACAASRLLAPPDSWRATGILARSNRRGARALPAIDHSKETFTSAGRYERQEARPNFRV
jgi:hypothetical protein